MVICMCADVQKNIEKYYIDVKESCHQSLPSKCMWSVVYVMRFLNEIVFSACWVNNEINAVNTIVHTLHRKYNFIQKSHNENKSFHWS